MLSILFSGLNPNSVAAQTLVPEIFGPYKEQAGDFYIKVYISYVDPEPQGSWTNSVDLADRSTGILTTLNNAYNEHGIHFVGDRDSDCNSKFWRITQDDAHSYKEFALDIFDKGDPNGNPPQGITGAGSGGILPIDFLEILGARGTTPGSHTEVLVHEVGHALGLVHTYFGFVMGEGDCEDITNDCNLDDSCCECGDFICDIEGHDQSLIIFQNNNCSMPPPGVSEAIYRNYMSKTAPGECRDQFSDDQARRLRQYLAEAPILQKMQGITTWPANGPQTISGGIIVESGELVINSPIEMLPSAFIKVKRGAKLTINSTLTGSCGKMWRGIMVEGNDLFPQNAADQGWVVVSGNGKIEHAEYGIDVQCRDRGDIIEEGTGGGIVEVIWGGKLVNNKVGVRFGDYSFGLNANKSRFFYAELSVSDDYLGGNVQPILADLTKVIRVKFNNSDFKDTRTGCTDPKSRAIGIDSKDAGFISNINNFEDLSVAVRADKLTENTGSFRVFGCNITNCVKGVTTISTNSFMINNNIVDIDRPADCPETNIELIGAELMGKTNGFSFQRNQFSYNGTSFPNETLIGSDCRDLDEGTNNLIFGNTYTNLHFGNRATGDNGFVMDGLLYLCNLNQYDASFDVGTDPFAFFDYRVTTGSTIREKQGFLNADELFEPTGNIFNDFGNTFQNLGMTVDYFYYEGDLLQDPTEGVSAGLNPIGDDDASTICPTPPKPCDHPCDDDILLSQWKSDFYVNRNEWLQNNALLPTLTDPAQIETTESEIAQLRRLMNKDGKKIIMEYSLDTVIIETDSLLHWMGLIETYPLDLQLARHYFFTGDFTTHDQIWNNLTSKFTLTTTQQNEVSDLKSVYDVIRPPFLAGNPLNRLPDSTLTQLQLLAPYCDEPGYLAQVVLWRNGIVVAPDCQTVGERSFNQKPANILSFDSDFLLYPNPTNSEVTIEFKENILPDGLIRIYNNQGQLMESIRLSSQISKIIVATEHYSAGIYFVEYLSSQKKNSIQKLIISR